jgi:hypothetical protein
VSSVQEHIPREVIDEMIRFFMNGRPNGRIVLDIKDGVVVGYEIRKTARVKPPYEERDRVARLSPQANRSSAPY